MWTKADRPNVAPKRLTTARRVYEGPDLEDDDWDAGGNGAAWVMCRGIWEAQVQRARKVGGREGRKEVVKAGAEVMVGDVSRV